MTISMEPLLGAVRSAGCALYYEEVGEGVPILMIHPAGSTASTWGAATEELARIGRVITYDRRGYAHSGGEPARSISTHTADAAAILAAQKSPANGLTLCTGSYGAGAQNDLPAMAKRFAADIHFAHLRKDSARLAPTGIALRHNRNGKQLTGTA